MIRRSLIAALICLVGCTGGAQRMGPRELPDDPIEPAAEDDAEAPAPPFAPAPVHARALLGFEYTNAVSDLLGPAAAAVVVPPPDTQLNGFSAIAASTTTLSTTAVRAYELSATAASEAAFSDSNPARDALLPCTPSGPSDDACLEAFVRSFGRRAFRRSLQDEEVALYLPVAKDAASAYSDFYKGAQFAASALLQSPNFLYEVELGVPDPADPSRRKLTGVELATRLSFFLAGTTPSNALLDVAEHGGLDTVDGLKAQAELLLKAPSARTALAAFFDEYLSLGSLSKLSKDPATFPMFNAQLAQAMRTETQTMIETLVFESNSDFRAFFDADYTYVNHDLAVLYGLADPPASGFERRLLDPASSRGGFFGQAAFLATQAHPRLTSPTYRGKFVRERLLCQPIGAPPNGVNTAAVLAEDASTGPQTMRQKLAAHRTNPSCASCHVLMDDIGFGLEHFDAVGAYRDTDQGLAIDSVTSPKDLGTFSGPKELGTLLKDDKRVSSCITRSLFRVALGHVELSTEEQPIRDATAQFRAQGYKLQDALVAVATSDAFRYAAKGDAP